MVDALAADALEPEPWPQALFRGHEWPNEFFRGFPDIYAVELSARGLDSHVWMEGYIIRGPTAGFLMRAAIPFRPGYAKPNAEKVFSGPYPETSAMKSLLSIRTRFPGNTMPADY